MIIHPMERAIALATHNVRTAAGGPFGAVVVRNGEIIAEGANQVTGHLDPTAHAEIVAIRRACQVVGHFELTDCELYSSCEPCPMCLGAIYWARIGHLYFAANREDAEQAGFDDSLIYDEIALPFARRRIPTSNIMRPAGKAPFDEWRLAANKVPY